jgi:hypothetical protein
VLVCEENFEQCFANVQTVTDPRVRACTTGSTSTRPLTRFDFAQVPKRVFRFGRVVEIDPTDPASTPRKRTAMGRFKHEGATAKATLAEFGAAGLAAVGVELSRHLASALEEIAAEQGIAAVDLAAVWFVD